MTVPALVPIGSPPQQLTPLVLAAGIVTITPPATPTPVPVMPVPGPQGPPGAVVLPAVIDLGGPNNTTGA